jgi:hypothetical protein
MRKKSAVIGEGDTFWPFWPYMYKYGRYGWIFKQWME